MNNKKDYYHIKKSRIIWISLGVVFVILFFLIPKSTSFTFEFENTGEFVDGNVFFDDSFYESTKEGKIKIYSGELDYKEIRFESSYSGEDFVLYYDFPDDYWDYYEVPFLVSQKDIDDYVKEYSDSFSGVSFNHWRHMPLAYKFENLCSQRQLDLFNLAFEKIEEETSTIVSFIEDDENPDISIYCKPNEYEENEYYSYSKKIADALPYFSGNLITYGEINMYGQGQNCGTGYPALEVHEILHLFEIPHNPLKNSIMHPYAAPSSRECDVEKIDAEYISCLKYIYSNGTLNGNCDFPNVVYDSGDF